MTTDPRRDSLIRDLAAMSDSEFDSVAKEARKEPDSLKAAMEAAAAAIRGNHR